jgi:histidinol-phosphatase (PHP family)
LTPGHFNTYDAPIMNQPAFQGLPDYHTHTHLCKHAHGEPEDYLDRLEPAGIGQVAITDHCPSPHAYDPRNRMSLNDFDTYARWCRDLRLRNPDRVRWGVEADFYQGCVGFQRPFFEEHDFDVVLGAVHYQCYWSHDLYEQNLFDKEDRQLVWKRYFNLVRLMAESGMYDVVCHLDFPKKMGDVKPEGFILEVADRALSAIRDAGMAIEINTSGLHHPVEEIYPAPYLLKTARRFGIPITFGSNAHRPTELGRDFDKALQAAQKAGYKEMAVYNQRERMMLPLPEDEN